ncbi:NADH-quinone oxidoreductase subunit NuoK [Haliscomenobacter sp.]|jgi:NADH-quinone oxidoreductase subunit K|uniref:NADH-quinone oxidoreductase subunit NuoK n=1 Tax=Haliscomenobacter sp. TaxID=2717303 RepID=UPI003364E691
MENIFNVVPLEHFVLLSLALFCIGMVGVLLRRNMIVVFMSIELMLNAVNLLAVAFSANRGDSGGQVFVFFVMVVAAAEVALGLAILVMIYRNVKSVDINALKQLKW